MRDYSSYNLLSGSPQTDVVPMKNPESRRPRRSHWFSFPLVRVWVGLGTEGHCDGLFFGGGRRKSFGILVKVGDSLMLKQK